MNVGYLMFGGAAVVRRYKIGETFSTAGVPAVQPWAEDKAGLMLATTTTATDYVGLTVDTGTYSTTQGDAEGLVSVVINPDVVIRARMADTATAGTQLDRIRNSAASTTGLTITITTGDDDPSSPTMNGGMAACIAGANVGQSRHIDTVSGTTAVVVVPFLNDLAASGDEFVLIPWSEHSGLGNNVQLTSNLAEARQDIATGTGIESEIWGVEWDFSSATNARQKSYLYFQLADPVGYGNT